MGGPTTTTHDTQNTNQQQQSTSGSAGSSTVTPNMPDWYSKFLQGMPGQYQGLLTSLNSNMNQPLYGASQQANFQQGLNQQLGQAGQNINEQLARSGALNSNRAAQAQTGLALGGAQQMGNYLSQVPLLNRQAQSTAQGQLGNTLANLQNFKIPIGQTTDMSQLQSMIGNMTGQTTDDKTQQTSGGLMQSLLGGLLNAGMSALTGGLSGMLGGQGFGAGASSAMNPNLNTAPAAPTPAPNYAPPIGIGGIFGAAPPSNAYGNAGFGMGGYNPLDQFGQYIPQGMK